MSKAVTVTVWARGDHENTPEEALHHALRVAQESGRIESWGEPLPGLKAQGALLALYDIIRTIREEQVSDGMFGHMKLSNKDGTEASLIYAARIRAEAAKIDEALEAIDLALEN